MPHSWGALLVAGAHEGLAETHWAGPPSARPSLCPAASLDPSILWVVWVASARAPGVAPETAVGGNSGDRQCH